MAKTSVLDWDTTAGNNTDVGAISIQGTAPVSNFDNALREFMAETASAVTRIVDKAAGSYTAVKADHNQLWRATGAVTINFTAAATLTSGWALLVKANGGDVTLDPNASEQINGASTITIVDGTSALVYCNGSAFYALVIGTLSPISPTIIKPTLTLQQSATPTPTVEGDIQWDTDDNVIAIGDGVGTQVFPPIPASTAASDLLYLSGPKAFARLPKSSASWPLRQNLAADAPEYAHPLAMGNFSGLTVQVTSATQVTVTASLGLSVTAAITATGANGLDTGVEAANTWYHCWVVWSGTTAAALLSTSATAPTMPATYVNKVRVGAIRNDNSSNLYRTLQTGRRAQYVVGTNPTSMLLMASGSAGNINTPVYVPVTVGAFVPPTASIIHFTKTLGGGGDLIVSPNASYGGVQSTTNPAMVGSYNSGGAQNSWEQSSMVLEAATIQWASNGGSNQLLCTGWEDSL
jgi:hypothetical protein